MGPSATAASLARLAPFSAAFHSGLTGGQGPTPRGKLAGPSSEPSTGQMCRAWPALCNFSALATKALARPNVLARNGAQAPSKGPRA